MENVVLLTHVNNDDSHSVIRTIRYLIEEGWTLIRISFDENFEYRAYLMKYMDYSLIK